MTSKIWARYVVIQILLLFVVLGKSIGFPYLVFHFWGTGSIASQITDLGSLMIGVGVALLMGYVGYTSGELFSKSSKLFNHQLLYGLLLHFPLILYVVYSQLQPASWDDFATFIISGWLQTLSHPLTLIGVYGGGAYLAALIAFLVAYSIGVWMYWDDESYSQRSNRRRLNR